MPELPDITVYLEAIGKRVLGRRLRQVRLTGPFLVRTVEPPLDAAFGREVVELRRVGKRIAIGLEGDLYLVLHLMIAGRLHWHKTAPLKLAPRRTLASFDFDCGSLSLSEAGSQRRASLHVVEGETGLSELDPGGLEVLESDLATFAQALRASNHTLKRALTDPSICSGIGNAYSDEILHRAGLSPVALTQKLSEEQMESLYAAVRETLLDWISRLRRQAGDDFPEKVTAFREGMAVHGRYGLRCPGCGAKVQRIRYASNETNYCATCQTCSKSIALRTRYHYGSDRMRSRTSRDLLRAPTILPFAVSSTDSVAARSISRRLVTFPIDMLLGRRAFAATPNPMDTSQQDAASRARSGCVMDPAKLPADSFGKRRRHGRSAGAPVRGGRVHFSGGVVHDRIAPAHPCRALPAVTRVGLWRSWERASMAWKRSRVRIRPGPPFSERSQTPHHG